MLLIFTKVKKGNMISMYNTYLQVKWEIMNNLRTRIFPTEAQIHDCQLIEHLICLIDVSGASGVFTF